MNLSIRLDLGMACYGSSGSFCMVFVGMSSGPLSSSGSFMAARARLRLSSRWARVRFYLLFCFFTGGIRVGAAMSCKVDFFLSNWLT